MISVCITTYNGEKFLLRQMETILSQIGENDEVIVSDDGSIDHTIALLNELNDPRITIIYNKGEHGYTSNFENALRHAKGEYIFLSDQDDEWLPGKVERSMEVLCNHDFVVTDAIIVDAEGKKISDSFYALRHPYNTFWGNVLKFGFIGCCLAFRRNVLNRALPFPKNHTLCTHDNWLTLVGMAFYRHKVLHEPWVAYRRHGQNVSTGENNESASIYFRIKYRLYLLLHLVKRMFKVDK